MTGQNDSGDARLIVSGGSSNPASGGYRTNTDTRVTIGNAIFDFVDGGLDTAMLNLKSPSGRPAICFFDVASSAGEISIPDGERFSIGHWSGSVFTSRGGYDSSGRFLWGAGSYAARVADTIHTPGIQLDGESQSTSSGMLTNWSSNDSSSATLYLAKSVSGSAGTHAASTVNAVLGKVCFAGSDGAGFFTGAQLEASVQLSNWTATSHPTRLQLRTTPEGSVTPVTRLTCNSTGSFSAGDDNAQSWGTASYRWSTIFAGTATISTSDAREKQQVRPLSESEAAVAVRLKGLIRAFKFNDSVAEKGNAARIHVGVLAQEVVAAFAAEGLNAKDYALLCYDEWGDAYEVDAEGNQYLAKPAGNRYGIRYEELLAFVLAAL
jgi:hypothetical protein